MTEQEARQTVSDLLTKRGDTEIKIHSIYNLSDTHFGAVVSFTWHLNGHPKNVEKTHKTVYKDERQRWQILGI